MKIIIANSPKYGNQEILVDDEDYELMRDMKWFVNKRRYTFYAYTDCIKNNKRSNIHIHRLLLNPEENEDHIDGNGLNNQRGNLRICSHGQNLMNSRISKNNTTGYKGVHWCPRKRKFRAAIQINRKNLKLGYFKDKIDAAKRYNEAAKLHFGEFAKLNPL